MGDTIDGATDAVTGAAAGAAEPPLSLAELHPVMATARLTVRAGNNLGIMHFLLIG